MDKNLNKQIGQATKWSSITEVAAKLITPIVNMVLARLLAPEAFGLVATITMVISFAELFTDAGFQKYIIQHEFESQEQLDNSTNVAFWTNFVFSVIICGVIFIFRHQIAKLVGSPTLGNSISIASFLIIIAAFSSIQMARYKRDFDFKTLFFVRIGTTVIPLVVTIPLALVLKNYWAILIGTFFSNLFSAIVLTVKSKWKPKLFYKVALFKEMFSFSAWTLLESITIWLTTYIGVFIVGTVLNEYYLGLYKTTMTTVNSYMALITSAITPVLFSALSRYQNDDDKFKNTYFTFQRLTAIFVIPMGIGIFLFSDLVTLILLGNQWMEASSFLGMWGLSSVFTIVFSNLSSEVYRSKGNPKVSMFCQLIHLVCLVPVLLISVDYGFKILTISRSLIRIQLILTALIIMRILYKFKLTDMVKNILPMFISATAMGMVGYLLKGIMSSIWWQFVVIFICIVVYFAILIIFPSIRADIKSIISKRRLKENKQDIAKSNLSK